MAGRLVLSSLSWRSVHELNSCDCGCYDLHSGAKLLLSIDYMYVTKVQIIRYVTWKVHDHHLYICKLVVTLVCAVIASIL